MLKRVRVEITLVFLYISFSVWHLFAIKWPSTARDAQLAMQILDLEWIKSSFWQSLIYNHYQPPLFSNIYLGTLYSFVPGALFFVHFTLTLGLSTFAFVLFLKILRKLQIHTFWIVLTGLMIAFYPQRIEFERVVVYTSFSFSFMMFIFYCSLRYFETGRKFYFIWAGIWSLLLTLTNSFFHPLWAMGILGILLGGKRQTIHCVKWAAIILSLLLWVVPLKNWLMFGFFGSSSCSGLVLTQRNGVPNVIRQDLAFQNKISHYSYQNCYLPETYLGSEYKVPDKFKNIEILSKPFKDYRPTGSTHYSIFNYNYYPVIDVAKRMSRDSVWLIKNYPMKYLNFTAWQFVEFFSSPVEWLDPRISFLKANPTQNAITVRGFLYILGLAATLIWIGLFPNAWKVPQEGAILLLVFYQVFYGMAMGILVAILDGSRYRLPFELFFLILLAYALDRISGRLKMLPA